jgi:hypothetical protein
MVGAPKDSHLSYSLWRQGRGWSWGVYDDDGAQVAAGAANSRTEAETAISEVYRKTPDPTPHAA